MLQFANGQNTRVKQTVRYEDYKQFKAESTITFGEAEKPEAPKQPPVKK